jgi:hypothetical protein
LFRDTSIDRPVRRLQTTRVLSSLLFFTLALILSYPASAAVGGYDLAIVVKTGDVISGKTLTGFHPPSLGANSPAVDCHGGLAFYATYSEGALVGEGVFTPASLVLKAGDEVEGQALDGISLDPALNDGGTIVVRGFRGAETIAMVISKTSCTRIGKTIGGLTLTDFASPAINKGGAVAFIGSFSGGTGIFTPTALLAKSGEPIGGVTPANFGPPAVNNGRTVAFQSWLSAPGATAILTPTAVLVKTGDTIGGKTLTDLFFGPALNSNGTVAFGGAFAGGTGVFTQKAMLVRSGDTIGGKTLTSFGLPMIDDSGTVAFFGTYPGGEGIFTQSSVIAKVGDQVGGKTLTGFGQPAMTSAGTVAFAALFSDGSSAIVLARPKALIPAPESATPGVRETTRTANNVRPNLPR